MSTFKASPNAKVRIIEPTIGVKIQIDALNPIKKNVAAYARVSTELDEQQNSYAAQVSYYTDYINNRSDWNLVEVYADEGITGTNTKKRVGFKRMIEDARNGKIDLILTKSISRFARNTVDTLTTVRELKKLGVEVWFEKENIHTMDPQGEIVLTVMSSLAQEESRSISANVTWGVRKRMSEGQVRFAFNRFLGYRKGPDGRPEIVPEEAETVRGIYQWFLDGMRPQEIKDKLESMHIKSPTGKDKWYNSTILSILSNEKYKGDALLQKTITVDFLSKKVKKNEGELGQFYIEGSHPAIIEPDVFDLVQHELAVRKEQNLRLRSKHVLAGKIICGDCHDYYGHKVYRYKNGFHYDAWSCNTKYKDRGECSSPNIKQAEIEASFVNALKLAMMDENANIIDEKAEQDIRQKLQKDKELAEIKRDEALEILNKYQESHAMKCYKDKTGFQKEFFALKDNVEQYESTLNDAKAAIINETAKKVKKHIFIDAVSSLNPDELTYDEQLIIKTLEKIIIEKKSDGRWLTFYFTNGVVINTNLDEDK
ncbi:recombinase family protein [Candidatus Saccharibacteria bacterium]|nr:recombinase family protein [Candidatus Saccharibacteria bacterium]